MPFISLILLHVNQNPALLSPRRSLQQHQKLFSYQIPLTGICIARQKAKNERCQK
jgi:hypothetical protein